MHGALICGVCGSEAIEPWKGSGGAIYFPGLTWRVLLPSSGSGELDQRGYQRRLERWRQFGDELNVEIEVSILVLLLFFFLPSRPVSRADEFPSGPDRNEAGVSVCTSDISRHRFHRSEDDRGVLRKGRAMSGDGFRGISRRRQLDLGNSTYGPP